MSEPWTFFLLLLISCLLFQGFFAMVEMACVSFNKVRLQYYVSQDNKRAIILSKLLHSPVRLFGTALICINAALQVGSECSRRLYDSLGFNPDFSPLTQVVIVLIFAEIAPLFAGRRYAESAAMLGIPVLYAMSILLTPVIVLFDGFCRVIHRLIGSRESVGIYLSQEELQKVMEEREDEEFNRAVAHIFSLKNKTAKELMQKISSFKTLSSFATVSDMRHLLISYDFPFVPIYYKNPQNIVAVAYPRDLLRETENRRVRECAKSPWFITEKDSVLVILKQFQKNNQSLAVVLNETGQATGILTLDEIIDEIFGRDDSWPSFGDIIPKMHTVVVDRTFPGETKIAELNQEYRVHLDSQGVETLEELMTKELGHPPVLGESVRIDTFQLTVEEVSFLGAKVVAVRTIF